MSKYISKEKWKYLFHTVKNPMDGFYWIRHNDMGSVLLAILIVIGFSLSFSMNRISASFVVNDVEPATIDSLLELSGILLLYSLLCVGNWSVTCLMGGEGRLKDIAIAIGYSFAPMIPTYIIATIMSQALADEEEAFYFLVLFIGIAYTVVMLLIGIMKVHNYSLGKTLITMLFTFIAVLIIIFIALLLADVTRQVFIFFKSIYMELIFRT